jgi:hypothetical protein
MRLLHTIEVKKAFNLFQKKSHDGDELQANQVDLQLKLISAFVNTLILLYIL